MRRWGPARTRAPELGRRASSKSPSRSGAVRHPAAPDPSPIAKPGPSRKRVPEPAGRRRRDRRAVDTRPARRRSLRPPEPEPVVTETMAEAPAAGPGAGVTRSGQPERRPAPAPAGGACARAVHGRRTPAALGRRHPRGDAGRPPSLGGRRPPPSAPPRPGGRGNGRCPDPSRRRSAVAQLGVRRRTGRAPPAVPAPGRRAGGFPSTISTGAPARHRPPQPPRAEPKSDDLDEFHTWLQNLKR